MIILGQMKVFQKVQKKLADSKNLPRQKLKKCKKIHALFKKQVNRKKIKKR